MGNDSSNGQKRLVVENAYKIFGGDPGPAFELLKQGKAKDEIYKETGLTIGVQDANFSVYAGEVFVIMGLSGSGKSTLVRLLNRLIEPTSGTILVEDQDITKMDTKQLTEMRYGIDLYCCNQVSGTAGLPYYPILFGMAFTFATVCLVSVFRITNPAGRRDMSQAGNLSGDV
ncbi:MAG: ATP-binding cassette domain-containing protein [Desulfosalsimonas sp.]|uniref:ATP-binding cassette domain-containing protein n=1 Tax=Desulfosalsimonas sp. TaxID=3073848 RepID=UPI003970CD7F